MTAKKKGGLGGLARAGGFRSGVEALAVDGGGEVLRQVAPADLAPAPWQTREALDPEALEELVASIRSSGVLEPLLARELPGGGLQLLAGHRRREAAGLAGLKTVPVRVLNVPDDAKAQAVTLTENLAREDLSPWEEALGLQALRETLRAAGEKATRDRLAELTGRGAGTVSESLAIAEGLKSAISKLPKGDRRTLTKLPKAALLNASRGKHMASRVELLVAALAALREPGSAPGKVTREALKGKKKRGPGRPPRAFTLSDRIESAGRLSLQLRKPPEELEEAEALELLERLEPVLERIRRRAGQG